MTMNDGLHRVTWVILVVSAVAGSLFEWRTTAVLGQPLWAAAPTLDLTLKSALAGAFGIVGTRRYPWRVRVLLVPLLAAAILVLFGSSHFWFLRGRVFVVAPGMLLIAWAIEVLWRRRERRAGASPAEAP